jgi:hypothetical protein
MSRYRHLPSETTAEQYDETKPLDQCPPGVKADSGGRRFVVTIHGARTYIAHGDYIVQEPDGEHYYPCKPAIFDAHYELVS